MSSDVTNAREEVTERRALNAAESAAHPALANTLARLARSNKKAPPPLLRVPRSSVPPPSPACRTTLTPAPMFDDDVELVEDSGLLTWVPEEIVEELSARFLIDDEARNVVHAQTLPPPMSSQELEAIDEMGSEHLAFIETQGEIFGSPGLTRPISDGPKIRLTSLHEQALAAGIAQYSDGVPSHNLERPGQISTTLRIATRSAVRAGTWRHLPVVLVFVAGIGAGVFLATKKDSSSEPALAAGDATRLAAGVPETLADDAKAIDHGAAVKEILPNDPAPVVMPLGDDEIEVTALASEPALSEEEIIAAPEEEAVEPEAVVEKAALIADEPVASAPAIAQVPGSKARARTSETSDSPSSNQPATGTADPGVLMLAAKPPCGIRIDGKDTGLMTPQRVLSLSPGKHKVTLVNEEHGLKDSFSVSIRSGEKTKVIRDITDKIK